MSDQKIKFYPFDDPFDDKETFEQVFSEIDDELEKKLWEIFDREKNRRFNELI